MAQPASTAKMVGGRWVDGNGVPITGPAPLAQLGVGGRYVDPKTGRTLTIVSIDIINGAVVVAASG